MREYSAATFVKVIMKRLCLFLGGIGLVVAGQTAPGSEPSGWTTFADTNRHFHFEYPKSWSISTEHLPVRHYRDVFLSLSSPGRGNSRIKEQETSPGTWEFGPGQILNQLPPGAAYMDIGWWERPAPRFDPDIQEMEAADLSAVLKAIENKAQMESQLIRRVLEFSKWGRRWSIEVYSRAPVSSETGQILDRVLTSFRFDGVPSGDEIWAIGVARRRLPPEAARDRFVREGGSATHYVGTRKEGNNVIVTFTQHEKEEHERTWSFRVTGSGEVLAITGTPMKQ